MCQMQKTLVALRNKQDLNMMENKVVTFVTFCFVIIIAIRSRGNF